MGGGGPPVKATDPDAPISTSTCLVPPAVPPPPPFPRPLLAPNPRPRPPPPCPCPHPPPAGAVYGMPIGAAISWVGTLVGQILAFLVGRFLFKESLAALVEKRVPKFHAIENALFKEGSRLVLLLKLAPVLPDNIMNYALSLTSVTLPAFSGISAVALVPYVALYCYLGHASSDIVKTLSGGDEGSSTTKLLLMLGTLLLVGVVGAYVVVVCKRALDKVLNAEAQRGGEEGAGRRGDGEEGVALLSVQTQ